MSGEGRGRIGLRRDKRRGEERMGVEGGKGWGLQRGRVVGDVTGAGCQGLFRNASAPWYPIRPHPTRLSPGSDAGCSL